MIRKLSLVFSMFLAAAVSAAAGDIDYSKGVIFINEDW